MNIQPLGLPVIKLDDRLTSTAEQQPVSSKTSMGPAGTQDDPSKQASPSREQVDDAVKKLNNSISGSAQTLEFSVDDDSKEIVVKLIDQTTKEVVRQIPSAEALRIAKSIDSVLDKKQGLLISHSA